VALLVLMFVQQSWMIKHQITLAERRRPGKDIFFRVAQTQIEKIPESGE